MIIGATRGKKNTDQYFSKIIGKALKVLEILGESGRPLSLNELRIRLGMPKSSVFRILHTLEVGGHVERDASLEYSLKSETRVGPARFVDRLVEAAMPRMKELCSQFRESVTLAVLFNYHIEVVASIESAQLVQMRNVVGRIIPPHASSLGKSIAAFQDEDMRERLIRSYGIYRFSPKTITDEMELAREYGRIRRLGYALDLEESTEEGCCVGVPILRDGDGPAFAAMSISFPKIRFKGGEEQDRVVAALCEVCRLTSAELEARRLSLGPAD